MKHKCILDYVKGELDVYFTADLHLGHKNIVKGVSAWPTNTRDFKTVEEHDTVIIDNINKKVKEHDHLFLLGDFSFKGFTDVNFDKLFEYRKRINCKNIHFIYGNHDDVIIDNPELEGMFTDVSFYTELKIIIRELNVKNLKYNFVLSHYSFRTWNGMYQGAMMLYGHSHNMLPEFINDQGLELKTFDVGIKLKFKKYSNHMKKFCIFTKL